MTNNIPGYFIYINKETLDPILKDDPINDEWHRKIISAIYTLADYKSQNYQPLEFTYEELARTLCRGKYEDLTESFIESVTKGANDIYKWVDDHDHALF